MEIVLNPEGLFESASLYEEACTLLPGLEDMDLSNLTLKERQDLVPVIEKLEEVYGDLNVSIAEAPDTQDWVIGDDPEYGEYICTRDEYNHRARTPYSGY